MQCLARLAGFRVSRFCAQILQNTLFCQRLVENTPPPPDPTMKKLADLSKPGEIVCGNYICTSLRVPSSLACAAQLTPRGGGGGGVGGGGSWVLVAHKNET